VLPLRTGLLYKILAYHGGEIMIVIFHISISHSVVCGYTTLAARTVCTYLKSKLNENLFSLFHTGTGYLKPFTTRIPAGLMV
jgi:hypothetical protein